MATRVIQAGTPLVLSLMLAAACTAEPVVGENIVSDHAVTIVQGAWFSTESATFRVVHKPE
jgi:hypothetical protein